ncbi:MAG: hypothetical protein C5B55_13835 [Blastocatellia bacterium]|nr:MAG: hypothetical protein C5B55_13835 [Blastocatellia bacterium]
MRKFWAVVKREYIQRVRAKIFVLMTILAPAMMGFFAIVPSLIFNMQTGGPVKIAVVDQTGRIYQRLSAVLKEPYEPSDLKQEVTELQNANLDKNLKRFSKNGGTNIVLEEVRPDTTPIAAIQAELERRVKSKDLDGYLLLPADLMNGGEPILFSRNTGDLFTSRQLRDALSRAVNAERLGEANIDTVTISKLSKGIELQTVKAGAAAGERDSGEAFAVVFAAGFVMYLTILLYGQVVLGAVIEEKETRIAEILFSSIKPFTLMTGKLVGVSLVALTQLAIWGLAFAAFAVYGVSVLAERGVPVNIPGIPLINFFFFGLFFLLGYYLYSTLYAFIGSMVTTPQEGGQLAMPLVFLLLIGFYFFLPVSRSPDSTFSFWVSMIPCFAPVTMMVRIVTQTPPFWQIAMSLLIGFGTVTLLIWIASRIYRVGMLMYGKKATIPEVWRWLRKA